MLSSFVILYQKILKENVQPSVHLRLKCIWILHQDNDLKNTRKKNATKTKKDGMAELKQFCKEYWDKIPPKQHERLIVHI